MSIRIASVAYVVALGLLLGGIVHLASVLALPALARPNADDRLAALAALHTVTLLPRALPGAALPHRDPAMALAVCRYDLATGPLRVRVATAGELLSLAFYSPTGTVFYALTDRSAVRGALEVVVGTREQLDDIAASDPEDEPVSELRLLSPDPRGFVTFRALAGQPGLMADAEARVSAARCAPERLR